MELEEGELLWKVWVTERKDHFQLKILSAKRVDGSYRVSVIMDGPSGKQEWTREFTEKEGVVDIANDLIRGIDHKYEVFDLSRIRDLKGQMLEVKKLGWDVQEVPNK
jgi:hypothetical protein